MNKHLVQESALNHSKLDIKERFCLSFYTRHYWVYFAPFKNIWGEALVDK